MPLSKKRNRDRMRAKRAGFVQPKQSGYLCTEVEKPVQPNLDDLRSLIDGIENKKPEVEEQPEYDFYKRGRRYLPGTKLIIQGTGEVIEVPEVDADGNVIWDF